MVRLTCFPLLIVLLFAANVAAQQSVKELIEACAPLLKLHPQDEFRPSSTAWYLERVRMRYYVRPGADVSILDKGQVSLTSLIGQEYAGERSASKSRSNFFLQIPNDANEQETRRGSLSNAVCYAHLRPLASAMQSYDIQYWFFYPYNGDVLGMGNFAHEGDFEHITVRVIRDSLKSRFRMIAIYFAAHDKEGRWYHQAREEHPEGYILEDGHPVVYSAYRNHASYPTAGAHARPGGLPDDETADGGPELRCWEHCIYLGKSYRLVPSQAWALYSGRWGNVGQRESTSGPYGPAFQAAWTRE